MTETVKACETLFLEQKPNQSILPTRVSWTLTIPSSEAPHFTTY